MDKEQMERLLETSDRLSRTQRRKREAEELKRALLLAFIFCLFILAAELFRPVILFGVLTPVALYLMWKW